MAGKCIIIGAGDLTVGQLEVEEGDLCIAVDGGLSYCPVLGVEPDIILGDFDSVNDREREAIGVLAEQIPERVVALPVEKDDTDMLAAIKYGLEHGFKDFRIYAGMGGRFDHSLANVQCLLYLKNHDATGYLVDGGSMILVLKDESVEFQEDMEGLLSLFALGKEAKGVTIRGMKYPLNNAAITNDFPIGISNEFIGEKAYIAVEDGEVVCIVQY
ncbi:MAG: thiamine diphosphokinase [Lachnospiraceae bacterium]|nr:thiamine diphosphokinase [Lachnospiraceae bacterium]